MSGTRVKEKTMQANARVSVMTGRAIKDEANRLGVKFGSLLAVVITRYAAMLNSENRRAVQLQKRAMGAICDGESLPGVPQVVFLSEADLVKAHEMIDPVRLLDACNVVAIAACNDGQEPTSLPHFMRLVLAELEG